MNKLQYNAKTDNYEFEYEDGRKLSVNGDRWAECRLENVKERLSQSYPSYSDEEIQALLDTPVGEQVWQEVTEEELDADMWELHAVLLEPGEERPPMNAAWVQ